MGDLIKEFWGIIIGAAGVVVFVIRMEGRTNQLAADIERLWKQRDEDLAAAHRSRTETHDKLDRMDEKLDRLVERNLK